MKKFFIVLLSAVLIGGGFAYFIFNKVTMKDEVSLVDVKAFQIGVFSNYDNALRVANRNNGIVVNDSDVYRVYVAILSDSIAIDKLSKYYESIGLNYYIRNIKVSRSFMESISSSEELLKSSNSDTYGVINLNVLSRYEELL